MRNDKTACVKAPHLGIANRFKAQVIERRRGHPDEGKVVFETPVESNLILENGMNKIATTQITGLFPYCCIGSDSTPVQDSSGSITATTSGTTCTANTAFFGSGDVGKLLVFSTGQMATITAYTNNTTVTLSATLGVTTGTTFTDYRVAQTGLFSEIHRTDNYSTDAGSCGTTYSAGVYTHTRTYDFAPESSSQTYSEVGFSDNASAGANLNMRGIFSTAPISVIIGQQLRVIYYILVTVTPISPRRRSVSISGWPAIAYPVAVSASTNLITLVGHGFASNMQCFFEGVTPPAGITFGTSYYVIPNDANTFYVSATSGPGGAVTITSTGASVVLYTNTNGYEQLTGDQFSGVNASGATVVYNAGNSLTSTAIGEPSVGKSMGMSTDSVALGAYNSGATNSTGGIVGSIQTLAVGSYTSSSYTLSWSATYSVESGNSVAIRKLFTSSSSSNGTYETGLVYLFDMPQQKTSAYTLTVVWQYTWGRLFS